MASTASLVSVSADAAEGLYPTGVLETKFDQALYKHAVPRVRNGGTGGGVFVSSEGHFITNWHVVSDCVAEHVRTGRIEVRKGYFASEGKGLECPKAKLIVTDAEDRNPQEIRGITLIAFPKQRFLVSSADQEVSYDFVLAKIDYRPEFWVTEVASEIPAPGTVVFNMGYPGSTMRGREPLGVAGPYNNANGSFRVSTGVVKAKDGKAYYKSRSDILLTDVDGIEGSSGGPLFDEEGRLIGIVLGAGDKDMVYSRRFDASGRVAHQGIWAIRKQLRLDDVCPSCFR